MPAQVEPVVRYAMDCGWWPFDDKKDIKYFLTVWKEFGKTVHLLETFKKLETWRLDNPTPAGRRENVRTRYRTFCRKAHEWKAGQGQREAARRIEKRKPKPPAPPEKVNELLTGIAGKNLMPKGKPAIIKSLPTETLRERRIRETTALPPKSQAELEASRRKQLEWVKNQK